MAVWNDRRTPPGVTTDLSVQMGAKYSAPKPAAVDPGKHTSANDVTGKPKPPPRQPKQFAGKKK